VELAVAIGQETNREGGRVQERSYSSRSSTMAALWSLGAAQHRQGQGGRSLGEVEEGLEVLASYSPRSIAAQASISTKRAAARENREARRGVEGGSCGAGDFGSSVWWRIEAQHWLFIGGKGGAVHLCSASRH
jgi:hypothetical protein